MFFLYFPCSYLSHERLPLICLWILLILPSVFHHATSFAYLFSVLLYLMQTSVPSFEHFTKVVSFIFALSMFLFFQGFVFSVFKTYLDFFFFVLIYFQIKFHLCLVGVHISSPSCLHTCHLPLPLYYVDGFYSFCFQYLPIQYVMPILLLVPSHLTPSFVLSCDSIREGRLVFPNPLSIYLFLVRFLLSFHLLHVLCVAQFSLY